MLDFSVIVPTLNEEENIPSCLHSIFCNEYPQNKYEVIVVDNGSTDRTVDLAKQSGARVVQVPDVNISALRNYGARLAQGRILVFIDAACTVAKDWLVQAARYLSYDNVALFGSPPGIPWDSTWVQRTWFCVRNKTSKDVCNVAWLESMNMFIPRHLFIESGGFNEELVTCEDVDISYHLAKYGRIVSDQHIVATHHGEARTLGEFYRKEKWRGKSNYTGLIAHGFRLNEIPSLILPIYFLIIPFVGIIVLASSGSFTYFLLCLTLWQLPIVFIVLWKLKRNLGPLNFGRLWLLYNVYYAARAIAIF